MESRTLNAIRSLSILIIFGSLYLLISCRSDNQITVISYGGGKYHESHVQSFIVPFEDSTGTKVNSLVWNAEYGKLKSMVDENRDVWDVVEVTDGQFRRGLREGLFEELMLLPSKDNFLPNTIHKYGVGNVYWGTVLAYNVDIYGDEFPMNWMDFWDVKKFPGQRALYDSPRGNLEFALIADGVKIDSLYPIDVERAFKKLDQIKPYIRVWWTDGTQPVQLLLNGSVDLTSAWSGRIFALNGNKHSIEYTWNGAALELDWWVIPKHSKNIELASKFILFSSDSHRMAEQAIQVGYGPVNISSLSYVPDSIRSRLPTFSTNWNSCFVIDAEWWSKHEIEITERWLEWKSKSK